MKDYVAKILLTAVFTLCLATHARAVTPPDTHTGDQLGVVAVDGHGGGIVINLNTVKIVSATAKAAVVVSIKAHDPRSPLTEVVAVSEWMVADCKAQTLQGGDTRLFMNRRGDVLHSAKRALPAPGHFAVPSVELAVWTGICSSPGRK